MYLIDSPKHRLKVKLHWAILDSMPAMINGFTTYKNEQMVARNE